MREFLYRNSFCRYFAALFTRSGWQKKRAEWLWIIPLYLVVQFAAPDSLWLFINFLLLYFSFYFGRMIDSTPNLVALMPLTVKRKNVYRFLSPLVATLLTVLVWWLTMTVIMFVVFMIVSIGIDGGVDLTEMKSYFTEPVNAIIDDGIYVGLFTIAFAIYCYATGMAFGVLRHRKHRIIFLLCWGVFTVTATRLICQPYIEHMAELMQADSFIVTMGSPYHENIYDYLSHPLLCVLLCLGFSLITLAGSVVFVCKESRRGILR